MQYLIHTYVYIAYKQYAVFDMCTNMMRERERLIQEQNYLQKIQKILHYVQFSKLSSDKWYMGLPGGSVVKNLPAVQETWVGSLGWEDALEEGMATHSSILAWRIPRTEKPGGLPSMGSQRVGHD